MKNSDDENDECDEPIEDYILVRFCVSFVMIVFIAVIASILIS